MPTLRPQEIAFDDPHSHFSFEPSAAKPFLATPAAVAAYGEATIRGCLKHLQDLARVQKGIDYLQVFVDPARPANLWFIEDGPGGAITALLPSDY